MEGESFFASPQFFSLTLYTIGLFSFPINLFGAYCIVFQTPESMKSVKWSMFNMHFWSSFEDITVSLLVQPYLLKSTWAGIPYGILKEFHVPLTLQAYILSTSLCMLAVSIITIFENRYFLLFAEHTWWRFARRPFLAINYTLAILYYVPTVLSAPDQTSARAVTFKEFPEFRKLDTPENPIYVLVLDNPWVSARQIAMEVTYLTEALSLVFLLKYNMKNATKGVKMSENTSRLQKAFLKALYTQTSLPFMVILVPSVVSIFSGILEISTQSVNNLVYITLSCHGLASTTVMLLIQKPYREFCLGIVGKSKRRQKITAISTISRRSVVTAF
ncbi:Serpentine Receptor, class H [Caenorhabditis elegans]|uniref:Serpentine Receptor, class H n=1 Tax=Caenorhabditis elegans TaxID=6239 RepID=O17786_CAEEL|nr:Serpentine Receptor, class H [Caenorhabditis elegans]CAB07354.2 Serpentine Receptor, class H [Caenorhabditis elegans]|eukprot:NP_001343592.1 Serpentine Receptor, class H [Caenorhabditis elegans]